MKKSSFYLIAGIAISLLFAFQNCAKSDDTAPASVVVVQGNDISGIWKLSHVECYSSASLTTLTSSSAFSSGYSSIITIRGNSLSETTSDGSCTVQQEGEIIFQKDTLTLKSRKTISATGGSCSINQQLANAAITPNSINTSFTNGQNLNDIENARYLYVSDVATPIIGLLSVYSDNPGSVCYEVFNKQ